MAMDQLYILLAGAAALIAAGFLTRSKVSYGGDVPSGIPWIGQQSGAFASLRTRIGSMGNMLDQIESGYREVSAMRPQTCGTHD